MALSSGVEKRDNVLFKIADGNGIAKSLTKGNS
jgi:hypothetical protein